MSEANLLFENRDGIAWLTLNRPKGMNAINGEIIELYEKYIPEIANNDEIRAVVITGTGAAFCAGADLKEVLASQKLPPGEKDFLDRLCENVFNPLRDFPKPVIAALNGITMAGGLEMKTYGFVNVVTNDDELQDKTQKLALKIASKSPIALRRMKEVANQALDKSRDAALEHEQVLLRKHMRSYDFTEGLTAFSEKRKPQFIGK